jgi:predicted nucleic acid-binding protein
MSAPPAVGFAEALRFWLKLGFISFGGPAGHIAILIGTFCILNHLPLLHADRDFDALEEHLGLVVYRG